jgi:hypothetical protein
MSLNVFTLSNEFILLATDRRGSALIVEHDFKVKNRSHVFTNGRSKLHFLSPPHNFVVFGQCGEIFLDIKPRLREFEESLPARRLSVGEYAQRMSDFISRSRSPNTRYRVTEGMTISIAGYNEGVTDRQFFQFNIPQQYIPAQTHPGSQIYNVRVGYHRYVDAADQIYFTELARKLEKKAYNQNLLGFRLNPNDRRLLEGLKTSQSPYLFMTLDHFIEYSKFLINYTSDKRISNGEPPGVGEGIDIIKITPRGGLKIIKYENAEKESALQIADNNYSIECCQFQNTFQLNFGDSAAFEKRIS